MKRNKWISLLLAGCLMAGALTGCGAASTEPETADTPEDATEIVVFAAASLTETLNEIATDYQSVDPSVKLVFNFDSSGTLKQQIESGADCDVFISASPKQMNHLDITSDKNADGLDFIDPDTRVNLLENKVALAVPEGNPADVQSFDDLAAKLQEDGSFLLAMGNADVPVGQYTQKILTYYGLDVAALAQAGKLTYGSNVKEVTAQVTEAAVSCGVIYTTDAFSAGLDVVDMATAEMCGQVIYPAALLKNSANTEKAQAFLDYLHGEEAGAVFEQVGFSPIH